MPPAESKIIHEMLAESWRHISDIPDNCPCFMGFAGQECKASQFWGGSAFPSAYCGDFENKISSHRQALSAGSKLRVFKTLNTD